MRHMLGLRFIKALKPLNRIKVGLLWEESWWLKPLQSWPTTAPLFCTVWRAIRCKQEQILRLQGCRDWLPQLVFLSLTRLIEHQAQVECYIHIYIAIYMVTMLCGIKFTINKHNNLDFSICNSIYISIYKRSTLLTINKIELPLQSWPTTAPLFCTVWRAVGWKQ